MIVKHHGLKAIDDTEEMIMNENFGEEYGKLRRFRLEYKNSQGYSNIEGCVYLPANDPDIYENLEKIREIIKKAFEDDERSREG